MRLTKLIILFPFFMLFSQKITEDKADKIFKAYTIDNILKYRNELKTKIEKNTKERQRLSELGLSVNRNVLESNFSLGNNQDIVLLRLAEFLIDKSDDEYFKKFEEYNVQSEQYYNDLDRFELDSANNVRPTPLEPEPKKNYEKALEIYDKILNEFSNGEMVDAALYNKAYLLSEIGKEEEANSIYQEVIDRFPDSRFTPSALMSLAEYYFTDKLNKTEEENIEDLNRSVLLFKQALKYTDSERYDEALYRLGWAYYRLSVLDPKLYTESIYYFTRVVDDIEKAKTLDPDGKLTRPEIRPEAIQYIGVSFSDESNPKGGTENMKRYVQKLKDANKAYSAEVMKSLGDVYFQTRQDNKTIEAYTAMQELFPYYKDAAEIQFRIVEAHRGTDSDYEYQSEAISFKERQKLFEKFNTKSDWYQQVLSLDLDKKFEILNSAEKNAEKALNQNIYLLFKDAQAKETAGVNVMPDYEKLVQMCEQFLDHFPTSDHAFTNHNNMAFILDRYLNRFDEAYEEFIIVSNEYPDADDKKIVNAAYDAVIIADTLWAIAGEKNKKYEFDVNDSITAEELTVSDNRLIEAYENYIKISPNDSNAARFLAAIGGIYFNKKQFGIANKYLKTLLARFPGDEGQNLARSQLMDSYFARGQYLSAESIAKKIMADSASSEDQIKHAQRRFSDAIFKNAEQYKKNGKHFIAALEFTRLSEEATFEDRPNYINIALMNAAVEFEQVNEHEQAVKSYKRIIDTNSKDNEYVYKSLINTAFDYGELKQYKSSAETFEKLYVDYKDSTDAKQYLSNAGKYYEDSKSWKDAIRVNYEFANRYPDDPSAKDILFGNAAHYLKLDDIDNANSIYDDFTRKYPDDVRVVQAYTERGKYYLEKENIQIARVEFQKAVDKNEEFKRSEKPANDYWAGESVYELIKLQKKDYQQVTFRWPESNIKAQQARKRAMLTTLVENYQKLISYRSPRSFEAPYRIAEAFEHFADTYSKQDLDPNERNKIKLLSEKLKLRNSTAALYNNAIDRYKLAMDQINTIADKLGVNIEEEDALEELDSTVVDSNKIKVDRNLDKNVINKDSVQSIANNWIKKSKEKVTSIVFLVALQSELNIDNAIKTEIPSNFKQQKSLELAFKAKVLSDAVVSQIENSVAAHRRNLETSKELEIENKFTEESKRRIVINSNIIADEYNELSKEALEQFSLYYNEYVKLVPKPFGSKSKLLRKEYIDIEPEIENFLEIATEYTVKGLENFKLTIERAKQDSIQNDITEYTKLSILNGPLKYASTLTTFRDSINVRKAYFQEMIGKSQETNPELSINYEDGFNALTNFSQSISDNILNVLDQSYFLAEEMSLPKTSSYNLILKKLIKIDPLSYAQKIPRHEFIYVTDNSWKTTKTYYDNWVTTGFNDSRWKKPLMLSGVSANQTLDTLKVNSQPIWYADSIYTKQKTDSSNIVNLPPFEVDTATNTKQYYNVDSLGDRTNLTYDPVTDFPINFTPIYGVKEIQFTTDTVDTSNIYFRKTFNLDGKMYSVKFFGSGDGLTDLFFNGELITTYNPNNGNSFFEGDQFLISPLSIKIGENAVSLIVRDRKLPREGLRFYIRFEILPKEFSSDKEELIDETTVLDEQTEKRIQLFIKNRVLTERVSEIYKDKENKNPGNELNINTGESKTDNEIKTDENNLEEKSNTEKTKDNDNDSQNTQVVEEVED
jgi:cellulose synthase operon protein C